MGAFELHHGDCLDVLRTLPDNSVDAVVTDPPYGLSFMGKKWDYDVPAVDVWAECLRVLKPGGHLLAFAGTRTQHRMAVRIEDAGFEIRDMIAWVYGSGFPKSLNLDGDFEGSGTALKPALEPITMARKPLAGTVADNVLTHGTGALNIDACRVATDQGVDDPRLGGNGAWKTDKAAQNVYEGGYAGQQIASSPLSRWPANLIHDGSDEVTGLFPESNSVTRNPTGKQLYAGNSLNATITQDTTTRGFSDKGSAARFFYCAKASKQDRDEGLDGFDVKPAAAMSGNLESGQRLGGDGSPIATPSRANTHPTVKPTDLMRYLCRLVAPPGGVVLDPFMGSGSTGKAALLEGLHFVGIEREAEYMAIAGARIAHVSPDTLFSDLPPAAPAAPAPHTVDLFGAAA
jgi:site-specific DNA-methyltransferase (adenine-specific)